MIFDEEIAFVLASETDVPAVAEEGAVIFTFDGGAEVAERRMRVLPPNADLLWREKENRGWTRECQKSFEPLRCGRFRIRASWYRSSSQREKITFDPSLVFGSGHHGSTRGCVEALEKFDIDGKKVLDVGTGSGILAIAAAKMGALFYLCVTDEEALNAAVRNCAQNGIAPRKVWVSSVLRAEKSRDLIVANFIVSDVLIAIRDDLIRALKAKGSLILSGIMERFGRRIREAFSMREPFTVKRDGWLTIAYAKTQDIGGLPFKRALNTAKDESR
ncbi:MAG: 50S ribosomal protein L11 methyltransferase [Helicobacteraceae bacterium]|nr:50S ribosomal protein L11 methyltransferase [Helicobacteraceae bacterium]